MLGWGKLPYTLYFSLGASNPRFSVWRSFFRGDYGTFEGPNVFFSISSHFASLFSRFSPNFGSKMVKIDRNVAQPWHRMPAAPPPPFSLIIKSQTHKACGSNCVCRTLVITRAYTVRGMLQLDSWDYDKDLENYSGEEIEQRKWAFLSEWRKTWIAGGEERNPLLLPLAEFLTFLLPKISCVARRILSIDAIFPCIGSIPPFPPFPARHQSNAWVVRHHLFSPVIFFCFPHFYLILSRGF